MCFVVFASFGTASISYTLPSTRTRTKPFARNSAKRSTCSPLRLTTTGARIIRRVSSGMRERRIDHLRNGHRRELLLRVIDAIRIADAREQQPQVIVDFGDGADRRARVVRRRLLLDRDRRRQAFDQVDVGLFHQLQELARVRRQRLDVAALAFGVQRVERERALARSRQSGDDDQPVARQVEVEILEVVRARAADADLVHGLLVQVRNRSSGLVRTAESEGGQPASILRSREFA